MGISLDDIKRALGLQSDSPLTTEDAAKKLKDHLDEQAKKIDELRKAYELVLNNEIGRKQLNASRIH